jgi:hypothetical protein
MSTINTLKFSAINEMTSKKLPLSNSMCELLNCLTVSVKPANQNDQLRHNRIIQGSKRTAENISSKGRAIICSFSVDYKGKEIIWYSHEDCKTNPYTGTSDNSD